MIFLKMPSLEWLREAVEIDGDSPSGLRWRKDRPVSHFATPKGHKYFMALHAGHQIGVTKKSQSSYYHTHLKHPGGHGTYLAHRLVYFLHYGTDPGEMEVDHIDGNPFNNRVENLRLATPAQNKWNRRSKKPHLPGKGIEPMNGKWRARLDIHLGVFPTKEEAARAYQAAAEILQEKFALHLSRPQHAMPASGSAIDLIRELLKGTED